MASENQSYAKKPVVLKQWKTKEDKSDLMEEKINFKKFNFFQLLNEKY